MTGSLRAGLYPFAVFAGEAREAMVDEFLSDEIVVGFDLLNEFVSLGEIKARDI